VPVTRNSITRLSVPINTLVNHPEILTSELPDAKVGLEYRFQLEADGTTGPYRYNNPANQHIEIPDKSTISFTGGTIVFTDPAVKARVMDLPFSFPFYGSSYSQITVLMDGGIIMGQKQVVYPYVIDNRLRFFQNCGIFPFLSNLYYPDANNKVTFAASATETVIRWNATADPEGLQPLEFAVKILPDGKVWLYYGNVNISPDLSWISGLSAGNNQDFYLMNHNNSGIKINTTFSLELLDWPSWLSLAGNGDLHGTPDKSGTYSLPLTVTDWSGITSNKTLMFRVTGGSGVNTIDSRNSIRVFPNPATDVIWFEGYAGHSGPLEITLYDLAGNQVFSRVYTVSAGQLLLPVREIKSLPTGFYVYRTTGVADNTGRIIRQ
jgi:hypothetical protein